MLWEFNSRSCIPFNRYLSIRITVMAIKFRTSGRCASIIGLIILTYRRVTVKRIIATSTKGDYIALILLLIVMLAGLSSTFLNIDSKGFDYRTTIGPWFRSLFIFQPKVEYMTEVPVWFKIHIISGMGLFAVWPFTRLVHVFSAPIKYISRSYVIYRRRIPNELKNNLVLYVSVIYKESRDLIGDLGFLYKYKYLNKTLINTTNRSRAIFTSNFTF